MSKRVTFKLSLTTAESKVFGDAASAAILRQMVTRAGSMVPSEAWSAQAMESHVKACRIGLKPVSAILGLCGMVSFAEH